MARVGRRSVYRRTSSTPHSRRCRIPSATSSTATKRRRNVGLEIRPRSGWNRFGVLAEQAVIVLGADIFDQWALLRAAIVLQPRPWRRKRARVLDIRTCFQGLAVIDNAITLDHMQHLGVWRAELVDEGSRVQTDRIDDERIAILVMADGFAEP